MKKTRKSFWRFLFKFHRYTGLSVAIIIVMLSVTGIILNHTDKLQLSSQYVKSEAILDWYGIKPPKATIAFVSNNHWIIQAGEQIYLGTQPVLKRPETLVGMVSSDSFFLLGFTNGLILLSPEGDIIERIEKPLTKIAINSNHTVFINSNDLILSSDDALLSWQETEEKLPEWSSPVKAPAALIQQIKTLSHSNILPFERVLLDIHSGRFFGAYGVLIIDIAGILFILLAITGCWIWLRYKLRQRRHVKKISD
jgi:hypothetical protein